MLFIASLFVVSEALDSTGVTAWAGQQLIMRAGASRRRLVVLTMLLVAALTALISVNGAVAALVPMVVVLAVRLKLSPSQLLMPLAFAAHAGSMLALTGTPVNVLVSEAAADAGAGRLRLLRVHARRHPAPRRHGHHRRAARVAPASRPAGEGHPAGPQRTCPDARRAVRARRRRRSAAGRADVADRRAGATRLDLDLADHPDVTLVGVQRAGTLGIDAASKIVAGDIIVVRGTTAGRRRARPHAAARPRRRADRGARRGRAHHATRRGVRADRPAEVRADRRAGVPGHGQHGRGPGRSGGPAQGRGPGADRDRARQR